MQHFKHHYDNPHFDADLVSALFNCTCKHFRQCNEHSVTTDARTGSPTHTPNVIQLHAGTAPEMATTYYWRVVLLMNWPAMLPFTHCPCFPFSTEPQHASELWTKLGWVIYSRRFTFYICRSWFCSQYTKIWCTFSSEISNTFSMVCKRMK